MSVCWNLSSSRFLIILALNECQPNAKLAVVIVTNFTSHNVYFVSYVNSLESQVVAGFFNAATIDGAPVSWLVTHPVSVGLFGLTTTLQQ